MSEQMGLDPDKLTHVVAGLAGATVYGIFTVATLMTSGQHVTRVDLMRAAINMAAAALVGVLAAYFLAGVLAGAVPWVSLRSADLMAFAIGAIGWEVLPWVISGARGRARREAERQAGPQPGPEGGAS